MEAAARTAAAVLKRFELRNGLSFGYSNICGGGNWCELPNMKLDRPYYSMTGLTSNAH
jgi:hypothetical protein